MSRTSKRIEKPFSKILTFKNNGEIRIWENGESETVKHPTGEALKYSVLENSFSLTKYTPPSGKSKVGDSYRSTEYLRASQKVKLFKNGEAYGNVIVNEIEKKAYGKVMHLYVLDEKKELIRIDLSPTGRNSFFNSIKTEYNEYPNILFLGFSDEADENGAYPPIFVKLNDKESTDFEAFLSDELITSSSQAVDKYLDETMNV